MATKRRTVQVSLSGSVLNAQEAVGLISDGLDLLQKCDLSRLSGGRLIDLVARLDAQRKAIEAVTKPARETIKADILKEHASSQDTSFTRKGTMYQANVCVFPRTHLLTDKVKEFLGNELPRFQETRIETQIEFVVKQ